MLSSAELKYLNTVKYEGSVDAFLDEQVLRSRASKAQQVRLYGYWQRGKVAGMAVKVKECTKSHYAEECSVCGRGWGSHNGHLCRPYGRAIGRFAGCEGGL